MPSPYTIWYQEHQWTPLTSAGLSASLTRGMKSTLGFCLSEAVDIVSGGLNTCILFRQKELDAAVDRCVELVVDDPKWAGAFNPAMMDASHSLLDSTEKNAASAKKAADAQLADFNREFRDRIEHQYNFGLLPVLAESNEGALSQRYYELVEPKIGSGNFAAVADLLAPSAPSAPTRQETELLKLALWAKTATLEKNPARMRAHFEKWEWLPFAFVGPAWPWADFQKMAERTLALPSTELSRRLNAAETVATRVERHRLALMGRFSFDAYERALTHSISAFASTKYQRKENLCHAHYHYRLILAQTAKRLGLSIPQARMLTPQETHDALMENDVPDLNERMVLAGYRYQNGAGTFLSAEEARKIAAALSRTPVAGDVLSGKCACPGSANGRVRIVNTAKDADAMQSGEILVSYATYPELVSAMRNAAAIVTDRGGVTCHAAVVSRELNIPCVIGTKHA
ncbi:MAG: PEP-utilizing enzyme, partial [Candidatus Micrarchaeota archaeon]|nr:PEP-utilizing enzyme [Candidatus Micrarchaeota archaeon]